MFYDEFYKYWRFALDIDFTDEYGKPFEYADDGKQKWGDELQRIPLAAAPSSATINHDHSMLAVAIGHYIHLYEAKPSGFVETGRLNGHIARVGRMAFRPGHPDVLVSCAMNFTPHTPPALPTIIVWNVKDTRDDVAWMDKEIDGLAKDAASAVAHHLASLGLRPDQDNKNQLERDLKMPMAQSFAKSLMSENKKLDGTLNSSVFSPSGKYLIYLPGKPPRANGDVPWDIKIHSMNDNKDFLTLSGHRDAIMWTGYDSKERYIASVAWDGTSRIWDAVTGELRHTFHSGGQNWIGAFSPDGERFAFTCGDGTIRAYAVDSGDELYNCKFDMHWHRALAWSPRDNWLAFGGRMGDVRIVDIESKRLVQHRRLSTNRSKIADDHKRHLNHYTQIKCLRFMDDGRKLVMATAGDRSAEVYDLGGAARKWRFARPGTDSDADEEDTAQSEVAFRGDFNVEMWEESSDVYVAALNADVIRIWKVSSDGKS